MSIIAVGCSDDAIDSGSPDPTEVTNDARIMVLGERTVELGCELTLMAETQGGFDSGYEWRARDDQIATIDNHGLLTALLPGETSVVARGLDSGAVGEHPITVTDELQPGVSAGPSDEP